MDDSFSRPCAAFSLIHVSKHHAPSYSFIGFLQHLFFIRSPLVIPSQIAYNNRSNAPAPAHSE